MWEKTKSNDECDQNITAVNKRFPPSSLPSYNSTRIITPQNTSATHHLAFCGLRSNTSKLVFLGQFGPSYISSHVSKLQPYIITAKSGGVCWRSPEGQDPVVQSPGASAQQGAHSSPAHTGHTVRRRTPRPFTAKRTSFMARRGRGQEGSSPEMEPSRVPGSLALFQ